MDRLGSSSAVTAVSCGFYHGVALFANGSVLAWGDNSFNQTDVPPDFQGQVGPDSGVAARTTTRMRGSVTIARVPHLPYPRLRPCSVCLDV
jgi:alpha-tubulin suppressor-like RCC1 family protein